MSASAAIPGALQLTAEQRRAFDEDGYFVVPEALGSSEVDELIEVVDTFDAAVRRQPGPAPDDEVRVRNVVCRHPAFLRLLDHPRTLPLVIDTLGARIQLRGSNLDVLPSREPMARPSEPESVLAWHRDEPYAGWPTVGGVPPFMELKVGFYLTDLSQPRSGALWVIPGSHRLPSAYGADGELLVDPHAVVELNVPAGAALIFRTSLLHRVSPNVSGRTRKCVYLAYQHRWLRPSDYLAAPEDVLRICSPVQRQLLGSGAHSPLALSDPDVEPCSPYWTPGPEAVPLEVWAQDHGFRPDAVVNHDVSAPWHLPRAR